MKVNAWSRTDLGNVRENNEDAHLVAVEHGVFVMADGVGGSTGGEIASNRLVEHIESVAAELAEVSASGNSLFDRDHRDRVFKRLLDEVQRANKIIYEEGKAVDTVKPPATTCDVILLSEQAAFIAHVGDSRVYLLRGSEIFRITEDHTFAEQLRQEQIDNADVLERYKNVLTRSIGGRPSVDVDALFIDLQPGDHLLMCTDGVTDYLSGAELLDFARAELGPGLLDTLVDTAKARGGKDNITALLVRIESVPDTIREAASFDTLKQVDILGNIGMFKGLGVRDLLKIMRIVFEISLLDGTVLEDGDEPCFYIVAEGAVQLTLDDTLLSTVEKGQHFGEHALMSDEPQPTTARAVGSTLLLAVPAKRFRTIVTEDPVVGNTLLWNLLEAVSRQVRLLSNEIAGG